jgi:hypothetical protein
MKVIIVLASCLAFALAKPSGYFAYPYSAYNYAAAPYHYAAYQPAINQHHAQDQLGQYNYGYSGGPSAKSETRTFDGVVRGSYSYVDANNKLQTVDYTAGPEGFKAAATNLPVAPVDTNVAPVDNGVAPEPVEDTPEVVAARAAHLEAVEKAKSGEIVTPAPSDLVAPEPVEETPEVKEATAQHLAAVEDAKKLQEVVKQEAAVEVVAPFATQYVAAAPYVSHVAAAPYVSHVAAAPVVAARSYAYAHPWSAYSAYPYANLW